MYKSKLNRTVRNGIISLVLFVVVVAVLGAVAWVTLESNTSKPEGALYQYFLGYRADYAEGAKLKLNEYGAVEIELSDGVAATDTTPVYYAEEERFIVPVDMTYVDSSTQTEYYIPMFSEFMIENDAVYYLGYGDEKIRISNGFLYDGIDTYVLLEDSSVYIMEKPREVGRFSFVKVTNQGTYTLYDYATEEVKLGDVGKYEVRAENARKTYNVSMSYDTAVLDNGVERLLFVIPNRLDTLEQ